MTDQLEAAWEAYEQAHDALDAAIDKNTRGNEYLIPPLIGALAAARTPVETAAHADTEAHIEALHQHGVECYSNYNVPGDPQCGFDFVAGWVRDAALADPSGRCEANTSGPRPECVTWECSLTSGHMGHHETEDGAASWTDGTTRYPDLPKQEAQRG